MSQNVIHVEQSAIINASPEVVYEIISDYDDGHHRILPKQYFKSMDVEKGGKGAGTFIIVEMNVYGVKRTLHMEVTEPEPGRILAERELDSGDYTEFILKPLEDGTKTSVTIVSDLSVSSGIQGWIEKRMNPMIVRRIYKTELENLDKVASELELA